jgi:ATP-dependent Lon protease
MSMTGLHPALTTLRCRRWDHALERLIAKTDDAGCGGTIAKALPLPPDPDAARERIEWIVDELYARKQPAAGRMAFAWSMLLVDPRKPQTFWPVISQLQWLAADVDAADRGDLRLDDRLETWWRAASGDFADRTAFPLSIFAIEEANLVMPGDFHDPILAAGDRNYGIVVMPRKTAAKVKPYHIAWKDLVDARLPLIVAHDVAGVRRTLLAEYPHATTAIDLVLRDLREGEPVRFKPFIMVGPPGNGKSRLIRRIGDLLSIGVYRFDGGSSTDGVGYGGTPRGWSESTPCIPARAVQTNKIANPIVMVDEVEKASPNPRNGALWSVLLGHLERETAAHFRDAELDLSWVSHVATANSIDPLPDPLKDRYRIVKVSAPRLADLPALATNVLREIEIENGEQGFVQALAEDELDVIAKAWQRAGFSIRKLQKIVAATLEARDAYAMRH